ncbi:MAG: 60S ribosomal protein L36 [archaeon]|nr:60S ribosomal protein L36 [archaeon]
MELLKQSRANTQKKAYKMAKKSLGTHKRALKKRSELEDAVKRHEH